MFGNRAALLVLCVVLVCGCRSGDTKKDGPREVLVFAAASLTDAFSAMESDFEAANPRVDLKLSFAGSQSLRTQIENGAQPQAFASANADHLEALVEAKVVNSPAIFAENELVIVVPKDNPSGIESLADLVNAERLVLAATNVPAGAYAQSVLKSACDEHGADFAQRVNARVVSREQHVRQTLQKVVLGEADAAIVYATDAMAAGDDVITIRIPRRHNIVAAYPIANLIDAPHARLGSVFIEFVRSPAGVSKLEEFGFRAPEAGR